MLDFVEHLFIWFFNRFLTGRKREKPESTETTTIGFRVFEGSVTKTPVQLSLAVRARHTLVTGKSGAGKTFLLKHLLGLAISANQGAFLVDLHGDLTPFVLSAIAAEEARRREDLSDRVVVIAPGDPNYSVGLNFVEGVGDDFARSAELAEVLRHHAHLDHLGVRVEETFRNTFVVIAANGLTLVDIVPLLTNARFRAKCVANTPNPEVRAFFESRFDKASEAMQATLREPVINKISAFVGNPRFRHIVGQSKSTFSMRDAMDRNCWIVASLPKGELGAGQALTFASLLFTAAKHSLFQRKRKSFYWWFLDEAQNFIGQASDIETVLSEARKFGVGLTLANQFLDQYPASMRTAVLSVANFISFQLSSIDAATMAQMLDGGKSLAEQIKNLPQRQFILKSGSSPWIHGAVPRVAESKVGHSDLLRRSNAIYARPRVEIEKEISDRHAEFVAKGKKVLDDWD